MGPSNKSMRLFKKNIVRDINSVESKNMWKTQD